MPTFFEPRTYAVKGTKYPSVTTILSVLNKPALIPWAVNAERDKLKRAVLEVLTNPNLKGSPEEIWTAICDAAQGVSEADKLAKEAADIGTKAHELIALHLKRRLGEKVTDPDSLLDTVPEGSRRAYESFLVWAESVDLLPKAVEFRVVHELYGYAGTCDLYADVLGSPATIDFKSGKRIYFPEHGLQCVAYREAGESCGYPSQSSIVVRLPKLIDDPSVEAVPVPDTITIEHFLACLELYKLIQSTKVSYA